MCAPLRHSNKQVRGSISVLLACICYKASNRDGYSAIYYHHLFTLPLTRYITSLLPLHLLHVTWPLTSLHLLLIINYLESDPVSLLEVEVTDLDRRVGLCLGSTDEVSRFKRYLFTSSAYTRYFYTSEDNTRSYDSWWNESNQVKSNQEIISNQLNMIWCEMIWYEMT